VCRSVPFDTLMIFTTMISVISTYNTNMVVMVPTIWLCVTFVVVISSFSVIVSCGFISLLLVTFGITYCNMGSNISMVNCILLDGENISFDASLFTYIDP
jgi:hypothetical protein